MRPFGLFVIIVSCLAPLYAFTQLAAIHPNAPIWGQYLGVVSLITMAISQVMATRARSVEWVFGAMDKTYVLHKWLGIVAVVTMLLHDNIGAEIKNLGPEGAWSDLGEELGEIGMNGILILVGISLALFIPYHWWKLTHKFIGAFFVLCALHFIMIDKPFTMTDPVGLYVLVTCIIGVVSYAITLLPLRLQRKYAYQVTEVTPTGDAVAIRLTPMSKPMRHSAGQFAFFSFAQDGLAEVHPFTISAPPNENGDLRITVKGLGAYTCALMSVHVGTQVAVQGPYGRFLAARGKAPQIWIAAGIGITPFAALLAAHDPESGPVEVFYTFRGVKNAPHLLELRELVAAYDDVTLHLIDTANDERLTAKKISELTRFDLHKAKVLYCGPTNLRGDLVTNLKSYGVTKRRFHYEDFEIRSDIWPLGWINVPAQKVIARLGI